MNDELFPEQKQDQSAPQKRVLRTFEDDIRDAMKTNSGSVISIAMAEQKKKEVAQEVVVEKKHTNYFLIGAIVLLLISLFAGFYFIYDKYFIHVNANVEQGAAEYYHPVLRADTVSTITLSKLFPKNGASIPYILGSGSLSTKSVLAVIPTVTIGETVRAAENTEIINALGTHVPPLLARSTATSTAVGIYAGTTADPYIIFKVTNYEGALASMLLWENFIPDDLFSIFAVTLPDATEQTPQPTPLVTGSSTESTTTDSIVPATKSTRDITKFVDRTIKNKDMRVIQDDSGKIYFVYGFPNRSTLIMTTSVEGYFELINRLR